MSFGFVGAHRGVGRRARVRVWARTVEPSRSFTIQTSVGASMCSTVRVQHGAQEDPSCFSGVWSARPRGGSGSRGVKPKPKITQKCSADRQAKQERSCAIAARSTSLLHEPSRAMLPQRCMPVAASSFRVFHRLRVRSARALRVDHRSWCLELRHATMLENSSCDADA